MNHRWLAPLALALALAIVPRPCRADAPSPDAVADARARYKRGLELYQDGAFDAALVELQKAYDTAPAFKILYNIALVQLQLNDYAGASRSFSRYLEEGGKKIDAKRRAEVNRELKKLEGRIAHVKLTVNVDGADVFVDDALVGQSPLDGPLVVNSGKRKIGASKKGLAPVARVISIGGGEEKGLSLELRDASSGGGKGTSQSTGEPKPRPPGAPPKTPEVTSKPVPWVWWGVTGALAVGTTVAGVLTLGAQSDLDDKKSSPTTRQELDDASSKTRTLAIVTDVLLVGTVAVGGYSLYLTLDGSPETDKGVAVGVGPGSVQVSGKF